MQPAFSPVLLAACLATAAVARPDRSERAGPSPSKSVGHAYGSMLLGIAGPILLGTAMVSQEGGMNDAMGGGLIAAGVFLGPSTGQCYAQAYGSGIFSAGLRIGGAAMTLAGLQTWDGSNDGAVFLSLLGIGTFVAGNPHSLIDTRFAVVRYGERMRKERFGLAPTFTPSHGALRSGALAWLRF
jgi:hypothetical protein